MICIAGCAKYVDYGKTYLCDRHYGKEQIWITLRRKTERIWGYTGWSWTGWPSAKTWLWVSVQHFCIHRAANKCKTLKGEWKIRDIQAAVEAICEHCPQLRGLNLNGWKGLNADNLKYLTTECKSLERLDLSSIHVSMVFIFIYLLKVVLMYQKEGVTHNSQRSAQPNIKSAIPSWILW